MGPNRGLLGPGLSLGVKIVPGRDTVFACQSSSSVHLGPFMDRHALWGCEEGSTSRRPGRCRAAWGGNRHRNGHMSTHPAYVTEPANKIDITSKTGAHNNINIATIAAPPYLAIRL